MVGAPGSGKSFFAEHFSDTFGVPLVSWNAIRDELFNEPTFSRDEDAIIERVAHLMLGQLCKSGSTIIYEDGALTQVARLALRKIAKDAGYNIVFVWVQTDLTTSRTRALKRGMPDAAHESYLKRFTPFKVSDDYTVISGKHTYASQLKIVLRRLSQPPQESRRRAVIHSPQAAPVRVSKRRVVLR